MVKFDIIMDCAVVLVVQAVDSLLTRTLVLNPTSDYYLYDPQVIVLNFDVTFCPLLVCLFTLDIGEIAYLGTCRN